MNIGVVFPQTEFGADPVAVKDYAQTVESLGFSLIDAYDHVIGANPDRPGGWRGPYTYQSSFLEVFSLFGYMAAITKSIGLATNILILPQRQTVLVAKQAATLDVLSQGRIRLGVGLGWNEVEYVALNEDFHNRGRRVEEQVQVLRALWTQPLVKFEGRWHHIPDAGIKPLPIQRPIPIWFGGSAEPAIKRIARIADGWMINFRSPDQAQPLADILFKTLQEEGRDPDKFGIEARIQYGKGNPEDWANELQAWQDFGATYFSLNTMGVGFSTPQQHIEAVRRFAESVKPSR